MKKKAKRNIHKKNTAVSPLPLGRKEIISAFIIFIAAFLLYSNTFTHNYTLDDTAAIHENLYVQEGIKGIPDLFKIEFWHFGNVKLGYYRPLSLVTFAVEHQFFGMNPHVSHFNNVLLFAITGMMLFLFLTRFFSSLGLLFAFLVSLLFVAHPLHTEVIASIKSRDEILSFLSIICMYRFLIRHIETEKMKHLLFSLLFAYTGMLSKESSIAGIIFIPVVLYYKDYSIPRSIYKALPYFAVILIFLIQKKYFLGTLEGTIPIDFFNYPYRDAAVKYSSLMYILLYAIKLLFVPHPLRYEYSFNQIPPIHWNSIWAIIGLAIFIAGIYFTLKETYKKSVWGFIAAFFFVASLPMILFIISRGGIFAERFLYASSLSVCLMIIYSLSKIFKQALSSEDMPFIKIITLHLRIIVPFFIVFSLFSIKTFSRNFAWKDNRTLFSTDIKTGMNSVQNLQQYGNQLLKFDCTNEKDPEKKKMYFDEAMRHFRRAVEILPSHGESYYSMGYAYHVVMPNYDSAMKYYKKVVEIYPAVSDCYNNMGTICETQGKFELASYYYNKAVSINRFNVNAKNNSERLKRRGFDVKEL